MFGGDKGNEDGVLGSPSEICAVDAMSTILIFFWEVLSVKVLIGLQVQMNSQPIEELCKSRQ